MHWIARPQGSAEALAETGWSEFRGLLLAMSAHQTKVLAIAALLRRRRHALFGAHARNAYVADDPRTTQDIDVLLPDAAAVVRASQAIIAAIPGVTARATPFGLVQILDARAKAKIADLVPADEAITMAALGTAKARKVPALGTMRVPPREVLIAMKLDAASDPRRPQARALLDASDATFLLECGPLDEGALKVALSMVPGRARRLLTRLRRGRRDRS